MLAFAGLARAQMIMPVVLRAHVESNTKVELSWSKPFMVDVKYYRIYRGSTLTSMTLLDSTRKDEYADTPPTNVSTVWFYYVTAVTWFGESPRSNVVMIDLTAGGNIHGDVEIISRPVTTATVGVLYRYQVQAVARDPSAILTYSLVHFPAGMTINSTTGLILWTPIATGWFRVKVVVAASTGGKADQEFFITVGKGKATVRGTVTDSAGVGIARVVIKLYQINGPYFMYQTITDSAGFYSISNIDPGRYFARAVPLRADYYPQWYKDAYDVQDATPITVPDSGTVTVNFVLKKPPGYVTYTVSGSVKDTAGVAISSATVFFIRAGFAFTGHMQVGWENHDDGWMGNRDYDDMTGYHDEGMMGHHDDGQSGYWHKDSLYWDFSFEHESRFVTAVRVDSHGNYSVKLEAGAYIALALAPGYMKQFYNHKTNFLEADIIVVNSDKSGINFLLSPLSLALGEIHGQVIDSTTGSGVRARLIAFCDRWRHHIHVESNAHADFAYTTETDSTGAYTFTNLSAGEYIILAVPVGPYTPSFYSTSGTTFRWKNATSITINGNVVTGINIYVKPLLSTANGYTSISGVVVSGSVGVNGAIVLALSNSDVAGYAVTNAQGLFVIDRLAPGTYTVTADKPGYDPSSQTTASPGYNADGRPQPATTSPLNMAQTVMSVGDLETASSGYALAQNYPNPFNPITQIVFSLPKNDHVELSIYNILGQKIVTLVNGKMSAGTYQIAWDARDAHGLSVPSGIYLYQLKAGDFKATRRMLLLR